MNTTGTRYGTRGRGAATVSRSDTHRDRDARTATTPIRVQVDLLEEGASPEARSWANDPELIVGTPSLRTGFGVQEISLERPLSTSEAAVAFFVLLRRFSSHDGIRIGIERARDDRLACSLCVGLEVAPDVSTARLLGTMEQALAALDGPQPRQPGATTPIRPRFLMRGGPGTIDPDCHVCLEVFERRARLHHRLDRFSESDASRLLSLFGTIVSNPEFPGERTVGALSLLDAAEQRFVTRINDAARSPAAFESFPAAFARQAGLTPSRIAIRAGSRRLTYSELDRRSSRLARLLRSRGVGPESLVGVYADRTIETVVALLSIHKAGGAHVPLDPGYPPARLAHILADSGLRVLLADRGSAADLAFDGDVIRCDEDVPGGPSDDQDDSPAVEVGPGDLAYVLYTSGSTGVPKGVQVEHGQLANFLHCVDGVVARGVPGEEAWLAITSISFDISIVELFWTLSRGVTVVLQAVPGRGDAADPPMAQTIRSCGITHLQCTPSLAAVLVEDPEIRDALGGLRQWIVAGEALPTALAAQMAATGIPTITNAYGPTETTVWSTAWNVRDGGIRIGRPLANQEIHVLDERKQPLPPGVPGELWIGGAGVSRGYLGRPDLTADRFVVRAGTGRPTRLYRTGDLVRLHDDGELEYLGRADHQVKIRGHRIELGEIEAVVSKCDGVSRAVAVAREIASDLRLVAYVEPARHPDPALQERVHAACRMSLAPVMVPAHVVVLDALPLTPNGKIDRSRLPAPSLDGRAEPTRHGLEDPAGRVVARAFEELLGCTSVSPDDDFFALGGHSLLAVRLLGRIERDLGVVLPVATLLEASTVSGLAARVREARNGPTSAPGAPLEPAPPVAGLRSLVPMRAGLGHPLFCVHGAGGNLLSFLALSRHMRSRRPIYGLQARGVDGAVDAHRSIEEMARDYVSEVRTIQREGPFVLGGYSGGGVVALEMARQLEEDGESISALLLLDTFIPGIAPRGPSLRERVGAVRSAGLPAIRAQLRRAIARRVDAWSTTMRIHDALGAGGVPLELRDAWLTANFSSISRKYRLRPWGGRAVLLRAEATHPNFGYAGFELGWKDLLTNLEVVVVPGDHDSLVLEPHVPTLAERVDELLAGIG